MSQDGSKSWLNIRHVMFSRDRKKIFSNLSLECSEKHIGLLGNNGAGKSTLLRLINGLLIPQSGSINVLGVDVPKDVRKAMQTVGFVFQNPDHQIIFPTVLDELSFGFRNRGLSRADSALMARKWLEKYGCGHWYGLTVDELSEGQRQKLCIISISALEPEVIALDEPFSSLDLENKITLSELLVQLPQRLVVASHDLELLRQMERVVWLESGEIVADGEPEAVIKQYIEVCHKKSRHGGFN
jgi:biotin transport system ATP-binding protein